MCTPRGLHDLQAPDGSRANVHESTNPTPDARGDGIDVLHVDGHHGVVATKVFEPGHVILRLVGDVVERPSRYSVQIGPGRHIEPPARVVLAGSLASHRWRFLNHSCAPNAAFDDLTLIALRRIEPTEPITFDYDTTEHDMASPFECSCGSERCRGVVRGRRWAEDRARAAGRSG